MSVNYLRKFIDDAAMERAAGEEIKQAPSTGKGMPGVHPAEDQAALDLWDECLNANRMELQMEPGEPLLFKNLR